MLKKWIGKKQSSGVSKSSVDPAVQEWIPIWDIDQNMIWRKDNHNVKGIRVLPKNIGLLSEDEKRPIIWRLFEVVNGLNCYWNIESIQRPVDLDAYIHKQEQMKNEETHYMRRRILESSIRQSAQTASSGECIDLQFYVFLAKEISKKGQVDIDDLNDLAEDLCERLNEADLPSYVCDDHELREVPFIFLNPIQSAYERTPQSGGPYFPMQLTGGTARG